MSSLMFCCPQIYISAMFEKCLTYRPTDGRTNGRTDQRTDKASYRDAWTHLKKMAFGLGIETASL